MIVKSDHSKDSALCFNHYSVIQNAENVRSEGNEDFLSWFNDNFEFNV